MHTAKTAHESLKFLWNNYVTLSEKVDLNFIPLDNLEELISEGASERPFRIASWISRQGYYISATSQHGHCGNITRAHFATQCLREVQRIGVSPP